MKKNMGTIDRVIRLMLVIAILYLWYQQVVTGTLAIVLLLLAVVFAVTAFVGVCPLYSLFGLSTCPAKSKEQKVS